MRDYPISQLANARASENKNGGQKQEIESLQWNLQQDRLEAQGLGGKEYCKGTTLL